MAKMESKSLTVLPAEEEFFTKKAEMFGWDLLSSQEILSRDTHNESRADGNYSVTVTSNYVKLTFKRDTGMDNYEEIKNIEENYWDELYLAMAKPYLLPVRSMIVSLIIIVIMIAFFSAGGFLIVPALAIVAGWIYLVVKRFQRQKQACKTVIELEEKVNKYN